MGEPVTLYRDTGEVITVYGPAQALELYAAGYRPTPPEVAPEPEAVTEVAPSTPEVKPAPRKVVKRPKGGL
jgi:hypothetical protein